MGSHREISIGLVGSGFMARTYAECLRRRVTGARLAAVTVGSRAAQLAQDYGVVYVPNPAALVARPDIEAVVIATPETVHCEQTLQAAAAGKHILVEKPMAPTITQCDQMIDACERAGVTLMVVQSQRYRGVHARARQALVQNQIGDLRQIRHWSVQPLHFARTLAERNPFTRDPHGSGLLMGWSVHCFDLVRWLAGSNAQQIFAQITGDSDPALPDLSMMAQIQFRNGVLAQLWVCLELPGQIFPHSTLRTQLIGANGLMDLDGYGAFEMTDNEGWQHIWQQPPLDLSNPADPARLESFSALLQEFVAAIAEGRTPAVTGADGRAAVELCQAAQASARAGQVVTLPLAG